MADLPHFNGTGSVYVVSVNRRRNKAWTGGPELHYSVDLRTRTYTEPVPFKGGKSIIKYPWIYGYF